MRKIHRFLAFVLTAFFLASCNSAPSFDNNTNNDGDAVDEYAVTNVDILNRTNEIKIGNTYQLVTQIHPYYAKNQILEFYSSDTRVATISDTGLITALSFGTTTIKAVSNENNEIYGSFELEVNSNEKEFDSVSLGEDITMDVDDTLQLKPIYKKNGVVVYPDNNWPNYHTSDYYTASVSSNGLIRALDTGTVVITLSDSGYTSSINVTIEDHGGKYDKYDTAVESDLGYTGILEIGTPLLQREFMISLLNKFNRITNSDINFTFQTFYEDTGISGSSDASSLPAIFPYSSDQTLSLYQFGALSPLSNEDSNWIKTNMDDSAYDVADFDSVIGYPYASDIGVAMFYNSSVCSAEEIDTVDKLFALAEQKEMVVNYPIGNGFYTTGALMTYSEGQSLYNLTPTASGYSAASNFNSEVGLKGAKLVKKLVNQSVIRNRTSAPVADVLATIVDVSKVEDFKNTLGDNYAVSPLPWVDDEHTARLGSLLGYKMYGVNKTLSAEKKNMAFAIAKFLCSEYAQARRFDEYGTRPTLISIGDYAKGEPHIAALNQQQADNAVVPLFASTNELWAGAATAAQSLKYLPDNASDSEYRNILEALDEACRANN